MVDNVTACGDAAVPIEEPLMRHTGLHTALVLAVPTFVGAWLDVVGLGLGIGIVLAAVVTARWPVRPEEPPITTRDD